MIPDYVNQSQALQRRFEAETEVTKEMWNDELSKKYFDQYVTRYSANVEKFMYGGDITGLGLGDLVQFIDQQQQKMQKLVSGSE